MDKCLLEQTDQQWLWNFTRLLPLAKKELVEVCRMNSVKIKIIIKKKIQKGIIHHISEFRSFDRKNFRQQVWKQ